MQVRFLAPAELEMFEASAYYELQVSTLGENFLDIIESAIAEIVDHPETFPVIDDGIRKLVVRRFPFSVLYQVFNNEIIIVAIMHHKQKPRYWIDRLWDC